MIAKVYYLFFLMFFLFSCRSTTDIYTCVDTDAFDINIVDTNLNKVEQKSILNKLINESGIKFDKDSSLLIELKIVLRKNVSLVSTNSVTRMNNFNFVVHYKIKNRIDNSVLDNGKIIVIDDLNVSDNRFANYATNDYIINNFTKNLLAKLENKIKSFLINGKCKKF